MILWFALLADRERGKTKREYVVSRKRKTHSMKVKRVVEGSMAGSRGEVNSSALVGPNNSSRRKKGRGTVGSLKTSRRVSFSPRVKRRRGADQAVDILQQPQEERALNEGAGGLANEEAAMAVEAP
jgi:hypothetical protein